MLFPFRKRIVKIGGPGKDSGKNVAVWT